MRYRRRLFIPYFSNGQQVGHLIWKNDGMEAYTADEKFVGKYPTRREAAKALWNFLGKPGWTSRPDIKPRENRFLMNIKQVGRRRV
jgi:hypothetical protein